ncbi:uncharacterized protein G2W53_012461 [Senna tora]|uniref:Uncharacterized protein n=1 Tax=Senna tora TaxID=362788 RepID=A0A834TWT5_9FABA|nr:uncharacterized protein G2W53_012461 [Senna tora]
MAEIRKEMDVDERGIQTECVFGAYMFEEIKVHVIQ